MTTAKTPLDIDTLKEIVKTSPEAIAVLARDFAREKRLDDVETLIDIGLLSFGLIKELNSDTVMERHAAVLGNLIKHNFNDRGLLIIDRWMNAIREFYKGKIPDSYRHKLDRLANDFIKAGDHRGLEVVVKCGLDPNTQAGYGGDKKTLLSMAVDEGHRSCFEVLINGGADPMVVVKDHLSANKHNIGNVPAISSILSKDADWALSMAMSKGMDINSEVPDYHRNISIFAMACNRNAKKCVDLILQRGIDVNEAGGTHGNLLGSAINHDLVPVMEKLLNSMDAARINERMDGFDSTMLATAAYRGSVGVVKLLLEYGADPNSPCKDGKTALIMASDNGTHDAAVLLIDAGANIAAKDHRGWTANSYAKKNGDAQMQSILKAGEARSMLKSIASKGAGQGKAKQP